MAPTIKLHYKQLNFYLFFVWSLISSINGSAQNVPAVDENIPFVVTFGNEAPTSWGDDDFCQTFFFLIPENRVEPIFLRVYDPDISGEFDEKKGSFNTKIKYSIYGGKGCWSNPDAQNVEPVNNYNSGILIASKTFGSEMTYDQKWYTFGPFNPVEGEYVEKFKGRVFKVICEGIAGDDGNLYRYSLSNLPSINNPVEGGNFFTYEYTFRLGNNINHVSQIYPYIDDKTTSVKISNFDWDNDGHIKIISVAKNGLKCQVSGEDNWERIEFPIVEEEKNTSLEIQFIKSKSDLIKNNNVSVVVQNQYGVTLPFYVIPIGGVPVYNPKIRMIGLD